MEQDAAHDSAGNGGGPKAAADTPGTSSAGVGPAAESTEGRGSGAPLSAPGDTASAGASREASPADTSAAKADSASGKPAPPMVPLDGFTEVELVIGLETSTRTEILSGLREGDRVAADPEAIRRKLKEKEEGPQPGERDGRR